MTTRRHFLQAAGASAVSAVAFTGCLPTRYEEFVVQSRVRLPEQLVSAYDAWYATTCRQCSAGCGTIVRVVEGRAKKVEGNPDHPLNFGRSCARAQAAVQEEYHPDRLAGPLLRAGGRGEGRFIPVSWEDALDRLVGRLRLIREQGRSGDVALVTHPFGGARAVLSGRFAEAYGAEWLRLDPLPQTPIREASARVFGTDRVPEFDIENTRFLLTFGADFLSTWLSPVHYGYEYGVFRQGYYRQDRFEPRLGLTPRGYMVHVEPRFSMTASNADEWVPIRPGREGLLALSIAQVIVSEGLADPVGVRAFGDLGTLEAFRPEAVAQETDVEPSRIREIARRFATERPSLAFAGGQAGAQTNGTDNLTAVLALNLLVGNVGQPGGVILNPPPVLRDLPPTVRASNLPEWQEFAERLRARQLQAVLVHDANPLYGLPQALELEAALQLAPFVVSFSSFLDETTAMADLIMPTHLPLEDWGLDVPNPGPGFQVLTAHQPVVRPFYDTRSFWDLLLVLADELGGPLGQALPWPTFKDMVRSSVRQVAQQVSPGPISDVAFERFWVQLLQRGGLWESPRQEIRGPQVQPPPPPSPATAVPWNGPEFAGSEEEYPYHLIVFAHNTMGEGRTAHLPWMQAAPDPITTAVWDTWVELNPRLAEELFVEEGSIVRIETPYGQVELPVYVNPAAPPWALSIPMGQGHVFYGRWASNRGVNPMKVLAPLTDRATGALAYAATRARIARTGRTKDLPKFEGTVPARQLEDEKVLQITRGEPEPGTR